MRFFDDKTNSEHYEIQGPCGKGLGISWRSSGTHIAFTTGTGVLVFIDLVVRIFLENLNSLPDDYEKLPPDFKFVLYVSFRDRESSCCLELCEKVLEFCKTNGFDNFDLYVRLSKINGKSTGLEHWDKTWMCQ